MNNIKKTWQRILIVRTDRIGDVLLSTPVIKAVRQAYPNAHIAMMVSPYAKEIVEGNPYLNEVIIYDKSKAHKSWWHSAKFSQFLKKKKFDLAIILHPTNRSHLVTFFSGIPVRIGYNRKMGFLLTHKLEHTKQEGKKHERDYSLDVARSFGIDTQDVALFMPVKKESDEYIDKILKEHGIKKEDKLAAIHPAASCPSKIWPAKSFAKVADRLVEKYGFKVVLIASGKDVNIAKEVTSSMRQSVINLSGKTTVSQLASLLKRCLIFISNDSGPVHISSAVGTPVISIFGRNQAGLSPLRWGPVGIKDKFLHKEVGCVVCLAHNCDKGFKCLEAISPEEVMEVVEDIL